MSKPQTAANPQASADGNPRAAKEHKLKALEEQGIEAFPHSYTRTHKAGDLQAKYADLSSGVETEDQVSIAGRILAMRNSGMFIDLHDPSGHVQVFCHAESLPEDGMNMLKFLDLGDIIGVSGTIRRTPRGELSVRAKEVKILTKSIEPLPDKYHGINDVELMYRRPEVNMIVSQEDRETLRTRSKVVSLIRRYMEDMVGAVEVETPILQPIMGGATARPFVTHHNALDADFYLRVATELHLKRLVVGGFADDVFEIGRIFRNEGISYKHNPEFTSIEGYHAYKDYHDIMELVEDLVRHLVMQIHGKLQIPCGERELDFTGPWPRRSMCDLVQEATGINTFDYDAKGLIKAAEGVGVKLDPKLNWGQAVEGLFSEKVEPTLFQPIHVTDFPVEISPLAKSHRDDPRLVERFETYVNMCEVANAFTELNDPRVQLQRFMAQVEQRENGDDEAQMLDEDFVAALEVGLPPTGGWGMGIDRLVMMLTDSTNIRQVIAFPTLKPRPTE